MITIEQFRRRNPSITANCGGLAVGKSYCVEAMFEAGAEPETPTKTTGKPKSSTAVKPPNGVRTPEPLQPDIIDNCKTFYFVPKGESCSTVAKNHKIPLSKFLEWNPAAGDDCSGLWAETYACVLAIGYDPKDGEPIPSATQPANGIKTPEPTQLIIVDNCNKFHFVKSGDTCASIASENSITRAEFAKWNPSVGSSCTDLWANAWACVFVIGHKPSTTTKAATSTKPTATSDLKYSPTQSGIAKNCNKYHQVQKTTTCISIEKYYKLPLADFYKWNPAVGKNCQSLLVGYWVCVSVTGWTPTPTTPDNANGIKTPSPIQEGMTKSYFKFHPVSKTTTYSSIQSYYKVNLVDFYKWNPVVGSQCKNLWAGYNVCVGVIGQKPKPSPTSSSGAQTPSPIQNGMVKECKKFHFVKSTTTCTSILEYYKISMANLYKWNPAIGSRCTALWAQYWVCVAA
ncbi:hypothetical protein FGADI_11084 [Fusarium gaditjirri]|uniref:LysM domain-containing protein n=1 Tax=Fusarium gaditjirri TaxID=282569 RepID=A0A8H4SVX8_9HYPO|nr:hypothetical protein FGADI_11084 [Fusarium gaditjirri]